jgi:hypothetical protein
MKPETPKALLQTRLRVTARLLLLGGFWLIFFVGITRAQDYFAPGYNGPKPPEDLLSTYARFVEAARKGDADTIKSLLLPGVAEIASTPREPKSREYGTDINLPFLRDGFTPAIFVSRSPGPSQFLLRTASTAISFAKLESGGWRIYRYLDKPIE